MEVLWDITNRISALANLMTLVCVMLWLMEFCFQQQPTSC